LKDLEKTTSARIQAAESKHKSAEASLMIAERQVVELKAKLDWEYERVAGLRGEINELKNEMNEARESAQKAEGDAQAYYDQGFDEAANSLKSQLAEECNKHFLQGWHAALDKAGVDDASELYNLGLIHRPFKMGSPEEHGEGETAEGSTEPQTDGVSRGPKTAKDLRDHEPDG
jgi:chromosome segregation ATPase